MSDLVERHCRAVEALDDIRALLFSALNLDVIHFVSSEPSIAAQQNVALRLIHMANDVARREIDRQDAADAASVEERQ